MDLLLVSFLTPNLLASDSGTSANDASFKKREDPRIMSNNNVCLLIVKLMTQAPSVDDTINL